MRFHRGSVLVAVQVAKQPEPDRIWSFDKDWTSRFDYTLLVLIALCLSNVAHRFVQP